MKRRIIEIDEDRCTGCGACVDACHEGAIGIIAGKAKLLRDDYCDGLGDCLPSCPVDAITFVEREAASYNEQAVMENIRAKAKLFPEVHSGCPSSRTHKFEADNSQEDIAATSTEAISRLGQWPCQIKLISVNVPYFEGCDLLIAADCCAYAYASMHERFMRDKVTIIGCPKLDGVDYTEKLSGIIQSNNVNSITVTRMEVPCCGGLEMAAKKAATSSAKDLPVEVVTISIKGKILD